MFYPEFHLLHLVRYPESLSFTYQLYLVDTCQLYILLYLSLLPNLTYTAHSFVYGNIIATWDALVWSMRADVKYFMLE